MTGYKFIDYIEQNIYILIFENSGMYRQFHWQIYHTSCLMYGNQIVHLIPNNNNRYEHFFRYGLKDHEVIKLMPHEIC